MKNYSMKLLFAIVAATQIAVYAQPSVFELSYDRRQCFELRERVMKFGAKQEGNDMLFYRGVVANRFNELEESVSFLEKYVKRSENYESHLTDAYEILADNYAKNYEYGKAADQYKLLLAKFKGKLDAEKTKEYENMFGLWDALRNAPRQTVSLKDDITVQGSRDKANLLNIPVEINNQKMDFVFDTGANISTITLSTANKLGLKIVESDVSVGSSTDKSVKSKLAVAPVLKIGGATVRNAVFLVFDDESLYFPQINYQIHGIVGFPVIEAFGKVTLTRGNQLLVSAKNGTIKTEPNMCLDGLLPMVAASYKNKEMIFAFDTGAVTSDFYTPFFKADEAEIVKSSAAQKMKVGGAGGFMEINAYTIKDLNLTVGGKSARFAKARVSTEPTNENSRYFHGNLGQDLIKQFERMTLDFRAMRISFE